MVAPCEQTRWFNPWSYTWHHPWCVYRWHHSVLLAWQHPITMPSTHELHHQFTINWAFRLLGKNSCTSTTSAGTTLNSFIDAADLWNRRNWVNVGWSLLFHQDIILAPLTSAAQLFPNMMHFLVLILFDSLTDHWPRRHIRVATNVPVT